LAFAKSPSSPVDFDAVVLGVLAHHGHRFEILPHLFRFLFLVLDEARK
jgi:hypothetical protein